MAQSVLSDSSWVREIKRQVYLAEHGRMQNAEIEELRAHTTK